MGESNRISFKGQNIYVGIDVHLRSWSVTILSETSVLKRMSQGERIPMHFTGSWQATTRKRSTPPCTRRGSAGSGYTTGLLSWGYTTLS